MKKSLIMDILFFSHLIILLPLLTFFYVAYAITYLSMPATVIGVFIVWGILLPYPFYLYWNKRIKII
ncbi:MAG: hypothetical protein FE048_04180 [Thermoplasmata archaeon]|nr:MAG: hypothetical protein FE048_04180 [Thermoplasmata archaeon]